MLPLEAQVPETSVVLRGEDFLLVHPVPDGPLAVAVGDFAARKRRSLERIVGGEDLRAALLGQPIRGDRICAVLMAGRVVGYLSYRCDGAGAVCPIWRRFRAQYGILSGTLRYLATQITLYRGRAADLYIEGYAIAPATRGRGIGRALLDWLGAEVARRGKAGWRTEMPIDHDDARRAYERFGAKRVRRVVIGPFGWLLQVNGLALYRWTPPG